ncbi:hypothetical protein BV25DRAFT_1820789, partial [Artomyces pyxidatus]
SKRAFEGGNMPPRMRRKLYHSVVESGAAAMDEDEPMHNDTATEVASPQKTQMLEDVLMDNAVAVAHAAIAVPIAGNSEEATCGFDIVVAQVRGDEIAEAGGGVSEIDEALKRTVQRRRSTSLSSSSSIEDQSWEGFEMRMLTLGRHRRWDYDDDVPPMWEQFVRDGCALPLFPLLASLLITLHPVGGADDRRLSLVALAHIDRE